MSLSTFNIQGQTEDLCVRRSPVYSSSLLSLVHNFSCLNSCLYIVKNQTLNSSLLMRPLRKSFTNWQFSALSWASLVPSANSSDRSVGLGEAETDRKGNTKEHLAVYLNDKIAAKINCCLFTLFSSYLRTSSSLSSSKAIIALPFLALLGSGGNSFSIILVIFCP